MARFARLTVGLLAAGFAIATSFAVAGPAHAAGAPGANGAVAASEPGLPGADPNTNFFRWKLLNQHPCVRDPVVLVVAAYESTPCDSFIEAFVRDPSHVVYHNEIRDSIACPAVLPRIRPIRLTLGLFPAGPQRIEIEWVIDHRAPSGVVTTETLRVPIEFVVAADCGAPGPQPFVQHVQIGPPGGSTPPCVPPGDSIRVVVTGTFPTACFRVTGIELIPDISPLPPSPRIRIGVEDCACCDMLCFDQPVRWSASINLPGLLPSDYKLAIELVRTSCNAPIERSVAFFPFVVSERCANAPGCLVPLFDPAGAPNDCDARVAPGQPARLTLHLNSTVALAGVQGELALDDAALRIVRLAPVGAAEGMILRWAPTPRGAKFALISDLGAPIPPAPPGGRAIPVLAIAVELVEGSRPRPKTMLIVDQLLASDAAGRDVSWCPTIANFRFASYAIICGPAGPCDFNGDGQEDIRDLVLMMRCLRGTTPCGDPVPRFDCNGDLAFTLDDVLCCAERVLAQDCAGCPPGETRDGRDVKLGLGPPVGRIPSPGLPVRIEGAGGIGGARLTFRFPHDRYDLKGVDFGGAAASWLHVTQVSGGRVVVGLIDAGATDHVPEATVTLQLALKPGQQPGGEASLESADFTAHDGVKLATEVPVLRLPLGGTPRLALSGSRPNPFAAATRFAVTLDRPGVVEVGIYDLGGRRLVTIHRGELPAGTREFSWDGSLSNGSRARDGVYFYRVSAGTETLARKLVLLRSP